MEYEFSVAKESALINPIALNTVYVLHADRTYDVRREPVTLRNLVALRTLSGCGKIKLIGLDELQLTPETLLFCKYPDVESYSCVGESWDFWWFEFSYADLRLFPLSTLLHIPPVEDELKDCRHCLELLRKNDPRAAALASATLSMLLYKWLLQYDNLGAAANPHREAVQKVIEFIDSNLGNPVSIKEMAGIAGLCERRFRQVFTEITGTRPKKHVDDLRLRMAEALLKNTPFSLEVISEKLGYSNQFHFCTAFRKRYGIPPSQFRKGMKEL